MWVRARDRVRVNIGLKSVSNSNGNLLNLRLNTVIEFGTAVYRFAHWFYSETNASYFPVRILNVSIMSPLSNPIFIVKYSSTLNSSTVVIFQKFKTSYIITGKHQGRNVND